MVQCSDCHIRFHLLHHSTCSKCLETCRAPEAELTVITTKPQCAACRNISSLLNGPLCASCVEVYQRPDAMIPGDLLKHQVVLAQLYGETVEKRSEALTLFDVASRYQHQSTAFCLGNTVRTGINRNLNQANTARQLIFERKDKKEHAARISAGWVIVHVYMYKWPFDGVKTAKLRMEKIADITIKQAFSPTEGTKKVLERLIATANEEHTKSYPRAGELDWTNLVVYFHGKTESDYSTVPLEVINGTKITEFFEYFVRIGYGKTKSTTERAIRVRFVYEEVVVFPHLWNDDLGPELQSRRLRSGLTRKRKSSARAQSIESSYHGRRRVAMPSSFVVRRDPSPDLATYMFSRDPPLASIFFNKHVVECNDSLQVEMRVEEEGQVDVIDVATDWQEGKAMSDPEKAIRTGYIGSGFNKVAIYARYHGEEYVFLRLYIHSAHDRNIQLEYLSTELKLLSAMHKLKAKFDEYVEDLDFKGMPHFCVNFEGAFLGEVRGPTDTHDTGATAYFLATRMLPCGRFDKLRKFTGNDILCDANDALAKAIHAFAHYSLRYSDGHFVLCDLQGLYDHNKVMHLFDPQCHMLPSYSQFKIYWNLYDIGIDLFKGAHKKGCLENEFCNGLDLRGAELISQVLAHHARRPLRHGFPSSE